MSHQPQLDPHMPSSHQHLAAQRCRRHPLARTIVQHHHHKRTLVGRGNVDDDAADADAHTALRHSSPLKRCRAVPSGTSPVQRVASPGCGKWMAVPSSSDVVSSDFMLDEDDDGASASLSLSSTTTTATTPRMYTRRLRMVNGTRTAGATACGGRAKGRRGVTPCSLSLEEEEEEEDVLGDEDRDDGDDDDDDDDGEEEEHRHSYGGDNSGGGEGHDNGDGGSKGALRMHTRSSANTTATPTTTTTPTPTSIASMDDVAWGFPSPAKRGVHTSSACTSTSTYASTSDTGGCCVDRDDHVVVDLSHVQHPQPVMDYSTVALPSGAPATASPCRRSLRPRHRRHRHRHPRVDWFALLPDEIVLYIIWCLPTFNHTLPLRAVSKRFLWLARDPQIVRPFFHFEDTWMEQEAALVPAYERQQVQLRQHGVPYHVRSVLVDWMLEVQRDVRLSTQTFHLAVNYLDRVLADPRVVLERSQLQLAASACMWIAAKYEEVTSRSITRWLWITNHFYSEADLKAMERRVLQSLDWSLSVVTTKMFLDHFLVAVQTGPIARADRNQRVRFVNFTDYLLQLVLHWPDPIASTFLSSEIAAAATFYALVTCELATEWPDSLTRVSACEPDEHQQSCVSALYALHVDHKLWDHHRPRHLHALYSKYRHLGIRPLSLARPPCVVPPRVQRKEE